MGMDVYGKKRGSFSYNWAGWRILIRRLDELGVDTSEFKGTNDGEPISGETCLAVADALEQHGMGEPAMGQLFGESDPSLEWLNEQAAFWRNCGGCEQW